MLELKLTESGQVDHADRLIITWVQVMGRNCARNGLF